MSDPLGGFPPETFRRRRERALAALGDGVLVLPSAQVRFRSRTSEYGYRADSELYYLTGLAEPDLVAVLRGGENGGLTVFARERDPELELWSGERLGPERVAELTGADQVHPLGALEEELPRLLLGPKQLHYRMGADPRVERIALEVLAKARVAGARKGTGPRAIADPGEILDDLRVVKDPDEIERIRRAAAISVEGHRAALAATAPGVGEWELEAILDGSYRRAGADGPAYDTIVGGGRRACVLHYVANRCRVQAGELVLVDSAAALGLYHSDITRTWPVDGLFSAEQRAVYEIVDAARAAAVEAVRPGASFAAVHEAAQEVLTAGLIELGVLQGEPAELIAEDKHKPFYPHQTGHWIGLDIHDVGDYARAGHPRVLEPGMVFTVEPGLYFRPGLEGAERFEGIGVRIEDDVLVTAAGCENLTAALPTDADAVAELVGRAP